MLETLQDLSLGFSVAFSPPVLLYAFVGCVIGTLVGMLPGVGPLAGISLLLPATFGGRARMNVQNALAAAAAAFGAGAPLHDIRQGLRTFSTNYYLSPGRLNEVEVNGVNVIVDYCHNAPGMRMLGDFVDRVGESLASSSELGKPQRIGVIATAGDRRDEDMREVWLPIDAKFPVEDWERLQLAADAGDQEAVAQAGRALEARIRNQAADISVKYIDPPRTTDFAIMFLPTEGLYAEIVRRPGLTDELQRRFRVVVAGPTTFAALLNSLQMGFRTLAIEQRSSEVWQVLGAVKTEFGKFGDVLARARSQTQTVLNTLDQAEVRTRQMGRALKQVEALPAEEAARRLPGVDDAEG